MCLTLSSHGLRIQNELITSLLALEKSQHKPRWQKISSTADSLGFVCQGAPWSSQRSRSCFSRGRRRGRTTRWEPGCPGSQCSAPSMKYCSSDEMCYWGILVTEPKWWSGLHLRSSCLKALDTVAVHQFLFG